MGCGAKIVRNLDSNVHPMYLELILEILVIV
jgi:hypothetical protein